MSLLTKNIFDRVCLKNFVKYGSVVNEVRLNRTQYYTCLCSPLYLPSKSQKTKRLGEHQISLAVTRHINLGILGNIKDNYIKKWFKQVFRDNPEAVRMGFLWFTTLEEVNYEDFLTLLNMEDSFYSWFKVMELHTWILLVRLKQDKQCNRHIRKIVMEAFWLDIEKRAKQVDKMNANFKEDLKKLYVKFKRSLFFYDRGFLSSDMVFADILWSDFFDKNCDDPRKLEALIRFIRYQVQHMFSFNAEFSDTDVKKGIWTPLRPHYEDVFKGSS